MCKNIKALKIEDCNTAYPRVSEEKKEADSNMFEGMISVRAVLNTGCKNRMITRLLYAKERTDKNRREFRWLTGEAEKYGFTVETPPRSEIDKLALGTSHGGVIAFCTQRKYPELDISFVESTKRTGFYVMIEGIEDPFNFEYALRSVYSAGADAVILSRRNWMSAAGVVCRSSAGASELTEIAVSDARDAAILFRSLGFRVICADMTENSESAFDASLELPLLLIIGGEKRGISKALSAEADSIICLEYGRPFPEALSAASAAAILSYEILRQNREKMQN